MRKRATVSTLRLLAATALAVSGEAFGERDYAAWERWAAAR